MHRLDAFIAVDRSKIKHLLFMLGVFAAIVCIEKHAEAQNGQWCAYFDAGGDGGTNCGFESFQQCLDTVRGMGGSCSPDLR